MGRIGPEILGRLFDEHASALWLFARPWCDAAEDVVQDAFIAMARQDPPPDRPVAWLYRVVRNGAIAASRRSHRRRRREHRAADRESVPGGPWFDAADDRIDAAHAARLLDELEPETREIIIARIWGGLTFEEAARLQGCSLTTAHRRYQAGLARLHERLESPCSPTATTNEPSGPDLTALERRLSAWRPAAGALDRDRMLYDAGRAAAGPVPGGWRRPRSCSRPGPGRPAGPRANPAAREQFPPGAGAGATARGRDGPRRPDQGIAHRDRNPRIGPVHPGDPAPLAGQLPGADGAARGAVAEAPGPATVASRARSGRRPGPAEPSTHPVPLRPSDIRRRPRTLIQGEPHDDPIPTDTIRRLPLRRMRGRRFTERRTTSRPGSRTRSSPRCSRSTRPPSRCPH